MKRIVIFALLVLSVGCVSTGENGHEDAALDSEIAPHDLKHEMDEGERYRYEALWRNCL